jgi:hypothetical protein
MEPHPFCIKPTLCNCYSLPAETFSFWQINHMEITTSFIKFDLVHRVLEINYPNDAKVRHLKKENRK